MDFKEKINNGEATVEATGSNRLSFSLSIEIGYKEAFSH
jgi:hypothetical protein